MVMSYSCPTYQNSVFCTREEWYMETFWAPMGTMAASLMTCRLAACQSAVDAACEGAVRALAMSELTTLLL